MTAPLTPEQLANVARNLMVAKMFSLASCVMLFYDMVITFGQEVERIWMRKFTMVTALWFLNRYLSPLGYIVIIVSFHDPSWSKEVCNRYILFPEALKIVTAFVIGVVFIMRIYAIYSRRLSVVLFVVCLLAAELAVKIWAFTDGTSLALPEGLVGCILVGKHHKRFVFTWIAELVFDSVVFFLTLWRTVIQNRSLKGNTSSLINLVLRDGVIYFGVIFVANLVTVLLFLFATPNLKAVNASFSTLITSLMVSRLILNLRGAAVHGAVIDSQGPIAITMDTLPYDTHVECDAPASYPQMLFALRSDLSRHTK
ncbi:hypothetical protein M413DRAFT_249734 [Hebeloma cylindrosporum]|uniref:DUF6533 domain-containing protein n=1 Tax=Hebeloma cylindrosporum TaxID=76867 RepID=A0A0C3C329_HEBCY|nr:hypothetical protein M413DRAFT_249734 [Hebeloma cylindrosporum h7]